MKKIKKPNRFTLVPFKKLITTNAWKKTSEYVRKKSKGICYTCGTKVEFKKMHAGHLIDKWGHAAIFFDLSGLRGQCYRCNRLLHGNLDIYGQKLRKEIGEKAVEDLYKKSRGTKVWNEKELSEIAAEREKLIESIKELT